MINKDEKKEEEWETDEEEDPQYFRLKVDSMSSLKQQLNLLNYNLLNKKFKKLDTNEVKTKKKCEKYFKEEVFPYFSTSDIQNSEKLENIEYAEGTSYLTEAKPEVGTNLIFEIGNAALDLVGTSQNYYQISRKVHRYIPTSIQKMANDKKAIDTKIKKREAISLRKTQFSKGNKSAEFKKRRKKRKYKGNTKNTTVVQIKRIS